MHAFLVSCIPDLELTNLPEGLFKVNTVKTQPIGSKNICPHSLNVVFKREFSKLGKLFIDKKKMIFFLSKRKLKIYANVWVLFYLLCLP